MPQNWILKSQRLVKLPRGKNTNRYRFADSEKPKQKNAHEKIVLEEDSWNSSS